MSFSVEEIQSQKTESEIAETKTEPTNLEKLNPQSKLVKSNLDNCWGSGDAVGEVHC